MSSLSLTLCIVIQLNVFCNYLVYFNFFPPRAYTPAVAERISGHYETGEKLPDAILNNLERVRKHMAGFHLCNEIYKSRLDMEMFAT